MNISKVKRPQKIWDILWPLILSFTASFISYWFFFGFSGSKVDIQLYDTYFVFNSYAAFIFTFYSCLAVLTLIYQALNRFKSWRYAVLVTLLSITVLSRLYLIRQQAVLLEKPQQSIENGELWMVNALDYILMTVTAFLLINVTIIFRYLAFAKSGRKY